MSTTAQDEFRAMQARNSKRHGSHPEDARSSSESFPGSSRSSSPASNSGSPAMPSVVYQIPNTQFDANTGPKGVIADAQSFDRARKRTFRKTIYGMTAALGNNVIGVSEKLSSSVRSSSQRRPSDRSTASDASEEEDEFMRSWREKRLAEMKKGGPETRTRRLSPSKRRWGRLVAVDPVGYLDAVEKVAQDTVVVVMISDDDSSVSNAVENALQNIARKHDTTRFVKLSYQDAEMDPVSVPAILGYRNGDLFANLVSVIDELPEDRGLSSSSLEEVLKKHRVL